MRRRDDYNRPQSKHATGRARIRAVRAESPEAQLARRKVMLGIDERNLHEAGTRRRLVRALRHERRAARSGRPPYDPLRHLLLVRLERKLKKGALRRLTGASTCQS